MYMYIYTECVSVVGFQSLSFKDANVKIGYRSSIYITYKAMCVMMGDDDGYG